MKIDDSKNVQNLDELLNTRNFVSHISVDCAIFTLQDETLKVLLLKYHDIDLWSLAGGFVFEDEDLDEAARRVLFERTQYTDIFLKQFHTFGNRNRTERNSHQLLLKTKNVEMPQDHWVFQRFITVGYCSLVDYTKIDMFPGTLNETIEWFSVDDLPPLAFDHEEIVQKGLEYLRKNIDTQIVASNLLPEKFTMKELQKVYETVLGETFRRNNFQRKILGMNSLERLEKFYDGSANKAPYLYRFSAQQ